MLVVAAVAAVMKTQIRIQETTHPLVVEAEAEQVCLQEEVDHKVMVPLVVEIMEMRVVMDQKPVVDKVELVVMVEDQKVEMVEEVDNLGRVQLLVEMVLVMFVTLMELVLEIMVPQFVG